VTTTPNFEGAYGITTSPIRLIIMIGTIWRLTQEITSRPIRILEIGSWSGASTLSWGQAIQEYNNGNGSITCIDAWKPYTDLATNSDSTNQMMDEALRHADPFQVFQENIKFLPESVEVEVLRGWSQEILPQMTGRSFDLVYIDGDHAYERVKSDLSYAADLINEGGIICGDDLELPASDCDLSILETLPAIDLYYDEELDKHYHPGVSKAVGDYFGEVSSWYGYWAMQKSETGWGKVSLKDMPLVLPTYIPTDQLMELKVQLLGLEQILA